MKPNSSSLEARYQFHALLSQGGMGEVSTAWDTQLKRTVAIKRLKSGGPELVQNILQEAMRMASIRHPNIVTVYDIGTDEGSPYIVMEFVNGETMEERVKKGVLGLEEFVDVAQQTFNGLIAAHHSGLIHRDLKPSNIMLMMLSSGAVQVKILDFGMAKFISAPTEQTMNIDGTITGSISWISPEQLNRETVDARSDLYSLGCVFYYALSGIRPFDGVTTAETISSHLLQKVAPLQIHRPDLPPVLCQWVMALINRMPEHRYQSATDALATMLSIVPPVQQPITKTMDGTVPTPLPLGGTTGIQPLQPFVPIRDQGTVTVPMTVSVSGFTAALPGPHSVPGPQGAPPIAVAPIQPQSVQKQNRLLPILGIAALLLLCVSTGLSLYSISMKGNKETPAIASTPAAPVASPDPEQRKADAAFEKVASTAPAPQPEPLATPTPAPASVIPPAAALIAAAPTPVPAPVVVVPVPAEIVLRVHGSNTIGAKLLPALMEEFLKQDGATKIQRKAGKDAEEMTIEAVLPGESSPKAIEIAAHGSKTAFEDLAAGKCDIGIASRQVKNEEADACAKIGLGDLHSPVCEHVVGLDGIAILVNQANPVSNLTKQQISDIFAGKITDWSQVGGQPGPINLYARDAKSGTFDTFKSLVLGTTELSAQSKRIEDSNGLSDAVAGDTNGIGFVGLPFVRNAKALAVSEPGTMPLMATAFTVATEDYLLARRLFIYTPANPQQPLTRRFIEFALGDRGQEIVSAIGFVKQTPDLQHPLLPDDAPKEYTSAVKDAERISLNFRFRPNSTDLDNKSLRDLDRVTKLLQQSNYRDSSLLLFGFADGRGTGGINLKLSKERAQAVARELATRGITPSMVTGFGSALPVASNDTGLGREKNRRVEVWLVSNTARIGKM